MIELRGCALRARAGASRPPWAIFMKSVRPDTANPIPVVAGLAAPGRHHHDPFCRIAAGSDRGPGPGTGLEPLIFAKPFTIRLLWLAIGKLSGYDGAVE